MRRALLLSSLLAVSACGGESSGPGGGENVDGEKGCTQAPACLFTLHSKIEKICVDDECVSLGPVDMPRSSIIVSGMLPTMVTNRTQGWSVSVFHGTRPNGDVESCEHVLALDPAKRRNA